MTGDVDAVKEEQRKVSVRLLVSIQRCVNLANTYQRVMISGHVDIHISYNPDILTHSVNIFEKKLDNGSTDGDKQRPPPVDYTYVSWRVSGNVCDWSVTQGELN